MTRIFAVLMSFIILISSLSFNLSAHYCCDQLINVKLFGEADACAMTKDRICNEAKMSCCSDRNFLIEGEEHVSSQDITNKENKKNEILIAKLNFPILLLATEKALVVKTTRYIPPLNICDISVLIQSFLL